DPAARRHLLALQVRDRTAPELDDLEPELARPVHRSGLRRLEAEPHALASRFVRRLDGPTRRSLADPDDREIGALGREIGDGRVDLLTRRIAPRFREPTEIETVEALARQRVDVER